MHFYMIIGKSAFYLYRRADSGFVVEHIDGKPYCHYDVHSIKSDLQKLLGSLSRANDVYDDEISFSVIENADRIRNVNIETFLENRVKEKIPLNNILVRAVKSFVEDETLHIDEFGINYDGASYILRNNILHKNSFSLLAYNVSQEKLLEFV